MVACRNPRAWNIGAGSDVTSLALNGTCDRTPPIGASDGGVLRLAPLAASLDEVGQRLVGTARRLVFVGVGGQRAQLALRRLGLRDRGGVLVVVNDDLGALALGDLLDLRPRELTVEQDDASADPGRAVETDQEPPVVARQQRYPVAALHTHRQQAVGDGMGGLVKLREGELTIVVDDGRAVGRAAGVQRGDHAEFAPAPDIGEEGGDILRWFQFQGAGFEHLAGIVQLRCSPLGVLLNLGRCLERNIS